MPELNFTVNYFFRVSSPFFVVFFVHCLVDDDNHYDDICGPLFFPDIDFVLMIFSQYVTLYIYICTNKYRPFLHDHCKKEKEGSGRSIQKRLIFYYKTTKVYKFCFFCYTLREPSETED